MATNSEHRALRLIQGGLQRVQSGTANGMMPHFRARCLACEERGLFTTGKANKRRDQWRTRAGSQAIGDRPSLAASTDPMRVGLLETFLSFADSPTCSSDKSENAVPPSEAESRLASSSIVYRSTDSQGPASNLSCSHHACPLELSSRLVCRACTLPEGS